MHAILLAPVVALLLSGCSPASRQAAGTEPIHANAPTPVLAPAAPHGNDLAALPPAPGRAGGLPDDRTPISEAPFAATSAQGAANVVQAYYALIEQRRYGEARRLWGGGGEASGMSEAEFAAGFERYAEYHARIGAPGEIEGAAGSLYVEVPGVLYGRLKSGAPFRMARVVRLRRVNDVPGATAAQRRWHIARIEARPRPGAA